MSGPTQLELSDPNGFQTQVRAAKDGEYVLQVRIKLGGGALGLKNEDNVPGNNQQISKVLLVWDTTPPEFLSLNAINEAADLVINKDEYQSTKPAVELKVVGHDTVTYSTFLDAVVPVSCDGTKTYKGANPPSIASMPEINGPYVICARVSDNAGNVAYGRSSVIMRDVIFRPTAPNNFTAAPAGGMVSLSYESSSDETQGFLLVRSNDPITFVPVDGQAYMAGSVEGGALVMGAGSATSASDLDLSGIINYYAVFAYNEDFLYSPAAKADTITGQPFPAGVVLLINEAADGVILANEKNAVNGAVAAELVGFQFGYSDFLPVATALCDDALTYVGTAPVIASLPAVSGEFVVCVRGEDASGHVVYGVSPGVEVDMGPQPPTNFSVVANGPAFDLTWDASVGNIAGYLIVRNLAPVAFVPQNGVKYDRGYVLGSSDMVIHQGAALNFKDITPSDSCTYHFAAYSFDSDYNYSGASVDNEKISGSNPCMVAPANFALLNNSNFAFKAQNNTNGVLDFEFEMASVYSFATKTTYSASSVTSGALASASVPQAVLTHGTVYYWRMRTSSDGGSSWSSYSPIRSFRIDTSTLSIGFHMETYEQMLHAPGAVATNLTLATTNNGEHTINTGVLMGTYKSPAININEFGWKSYGMGLATWYTSAPGSTSGVAHNQYTFSIEYFDHETSTWAIIPSEEFAGNSGLGMTLHGNIDKIDPNSYPIIRYSVRLARDTTGRASPRFYGFTMQPNFKASSGNFVNGGFENANAGEWGVINNLTAASANLAKNDGTAKSGSKYAYLTHALGSPWGYVSREAYAYQSIDVPVTATSLKFWRKYYRASYGAPFRMFINDTIMETLVSSATTWQQFTYDLTPYRGQTITFKFGIFDYYWAGNGDHGSWIGIDDVTIE